VTSVYFVDPPCPCLGAVEHIPRIYFDSNHSFERQQRLVSFVPAMDEM